MASLVARNGLLKQFRQSSSVVRSLRFATAVDHKHHAEPHHAEPRHWPRTQVAHIAHGTIAVSKFHAKPEVREAQLLKMGREVMPEFVATAPGVWGLPGPRSIFFENHHNEWNTVGLWESASAMEAFKKSPEQDKLMSKFGSLIDLDKREEEEVCGADFHYYEPMRQCNWERYPIEVSEFHVKKGFRQQVHKVLTQNKSAVAWCHDVGLHFQVLKYNAAETHVVGYSVYRDLLKWEAGQEQLAKKFAEWGLAEFLVEDLAAADKKAPHQTHAHTHHIGHGHLHTNAWVFSQ